MNKDNKKCANCGEPHSASYRECPKFLASKTLVKHAALNHLSYRDALIQIRKQERTSHASVVTCQAQTGEMSSVSHSEINTELVSKVNKKTQYNLDADSPYAVEVGSASANQITPVTIDVATCTNNDNNQQNNNSSMKGPVLDQNQKYDVITHNDLYQLLAVLFQVSDDRSVSRSDIIKTILHHVFQMIDKPHDDIRQAISQYYSPVPSESLKDISDPKAKTSDQKKTEN